jgi:hypothetical protein
MSENAKRRENATSLDVDLLVEAINDLASVVGMKFKADERKVRQIRSVRETIKPSERTVSSV